MNIDDTYELLKYVNYFIQKYPELEQDFLDIHVHFISPTKRLYKYKGEIITADKIPTYPNKVIAFADGQCRIKRSVETWLLYELDLQFVELAVLEREIAFYYLSDIINLQRACNAVIEALMEFK